MEPRPQRRGAAGRRQRVTHFLAIHCAKGLKPLPLPCVTLHSVVATQPSTQPFCVLCLPLPPLPPASVSFFCTPHSFACNPPTPLLNTRDSSPSRCVVWPAPASLPPPPLPSRAAAGSRREIVAAAFPSPPPPSSSSFTAPPNQTPSFRSAHQLVTAPLIDGVFFLKEAPFLFCTPHIHVLMLSCPATTTTTSHPPFLPSIVVCACCPACHSTSPHRLPPLCTPTRRLRSTLPAVQKARPVSHCALLSRLFFFYAKRESVCVTSPCVLLLTT